MGVNFSPPRNSALRPVPLCNATQRFYSISNPATLPRLSWRGFFCARLQAVSGAVWGHSRGGEDQEYPAAFPGHPVAHSCRPVCCRRDELLGDSGSESGIRGGRVF